jgi:hypothetical protein
MTVKVLGGALAAAGLAAAVARHVAWYVSYRMEGTTRDDETAAKLNGSA